MVCMTDSVEVEYWAHLMGDLLAFGLVEKTVESRVALRAVWKVRWQVF
jgi:hypothetical protein